MPELYYCVCGSIEFEIGRYALSYYCVECNKAWKKQELENYYESEQKKAKEQRKRSRANEQTTKRKRTTERI